MAVALLAVSVAITAAMVTVDGGQLAYNFRDGYSRLAEWLSPLVDLPQGLPSFFRQTPAGAVVRAAVWVAAILLAWLALRAVERKRSASDAGPVLALATPACLAVAAMLALTTVWWLDNIPGPTTETGELVLLEHFDPRIRPTGVSLARLEFAPSEQIIERLSMATSRRRPAPPAQTLLLVPGVLPAGRYALEMPSPGEAAGTARLVIGRNARPIMTWNLRTDVHDRGVSFELPVDVGSIVVSGDEEAVRAAGVLSLRPLNVIPPRDRMTTEYARRVERYGPGLAFFFDDGAFVEEPGFWVRGGGRTRLAAMPVQANASLQLFVRNAPVPNSVEIEIDGAAQTIDLQPREERMIRIPIAGQRRAALINIYSRAGFRPSLVDPGSTDARFLGAWIELRE
jgi:hypothetical protein